LTSIAVLTGQCCDALARFDAELWSGEECAALAERFARVENAAQAARARASARAGACGAHRARGFASTREWMAASAGTSMRDAKTALEAVAAVQSLPDTMGALAGGRISLAQAEEIAKTEAAVPGTELELLELAKDSSLGRVRERGRRRRVEAMDPHDLAALQYSAREATHWRDTELGMVRVSAALTPEVGIPFVNMWDAETDRLWREEERRHARPSRSQCAADALAHMLDGSGTGHTGRADVVFVCDTNAAIRGHAHPGELCAILGGGPVPVSTVMAAARDAFIKGVLHDGVEIQRVVHYGRRPNALQRTALMLGLPPEFDGAMCSEPGCDRRYGLEFDHVDPVANGGATTLRNITPRCDEHHDQKTERDRRAGRLGGNRMIYKRKYAKDPDAGTDERGPP
jgi:Domain of unknown function (DUF222)/HNH endonuclease